MYNVLTEKHMVIIGEGKIVGNVERLLFLEVLECGLLKQGSQSFSKTNSRAILGDSCRFSMAKILLFQNPQFFWKSFNNPTIVSQITCMHKFHTGPVTKSLTFPGLSMKNATTKFQDFTRFSWTATNLHRM